MKIERIIKNLSFTVAASVVFLLTGGMYLSGKGFVMQDDGQIILMNHANAQDNVPPTAPIIPDNTVLPTNHVIGSSDAPITLYEYSSFGCSHCADFHLQILPKLQSEFIDKGLLRISFIPLPADKSSMDAALLAECVPADKYFEFIEMLFKKQRRWGLNRDPQKVLKQYAVLYGVPENKTDSCLHNDDNAREIISNRQNAISTLGIRGTPSFVISWNGHNELISGLKPYNTLKDIIESKLEEIAPQK
ncbi:MAG: DsbA family protein [Alphaproteobacteria bacterium]|nr:DsbA family protein [Alphaproteobacteria bacterium]